jgi:mRNA-degrading endonuclease RelE of RelBE toxin-antitoxin system
MDKKDLPILPKNWKELGYKKVSEKKEPENKFIKIEDIEIGGVYKTHVKDLVKVLGINEERKSVTLYNISGSFKQVTDFKNIALVEKV